MESQLELLETEAEALLDEVRNVQDDADHSQERGNAEEVIETLRHVRVELQRIRTVSAAWAARALKEGREAEPWLVIQRLAPTAFQLHEANTVDGQLDAADMKVWQERIDASRDLVAGMRKASETELNILEKEVADAAVFRGAPLLNPAIPSLPGARSSSGLSLQRCLEKLARVMTDEDAIESSVPFVTVHPDIRRLDVLDQQLQLQMDCRRLEPKLMENEDIAPHTIHSLGIDIVDRGSKLSTTLEEILFSRVKCHSDVLLKKHPASYPQSEASRGAAQKLLASRNAQEGFQGYVKHTVNRIAQLRAVAGIEFEVIPGEDYVLGCNTPLQRLGLYSVCGSVDHEARLDRRTPFWLRSAASKKTSGLGYMDGPQHYAYCGRQRSVRLHTYHLMKRPLSVGQLQSLLADRRFSAALEAVVPPMFRAASWKPSFHLQFMGRNLSGFQQDEVPHGSSDVLEVPYFVAEGIAAALGGVVCPFDLWEAGGRGIERDATSAFLFTDVEANRKLKISRKGWISAVDEDDDDAGPVARLVHGEAIRLSKSHDRVLEGILTPFRLEQYARCGAEWNSVVSATVAPTTKGACSGIEWQHATTPRDLSILQSTDEGDLLDNTSFMQSFTMRDAATAPASVWAPDTVDFMPTSHVLRSLADYGTQHIIDGTTASEVCDGKSFADDDVFRPDNERSFVGTALYTFGLPQRGLGGPVAAFRIAFPATSEALAALEEAIQERDAACGCDVNFLDLVGSLGKQRKHVAAFRSMLFTDFSKDSLYNTLHYKFAAGGFDVVFAAEVPNPVEQLDFYGSHLLSRPNIVERKSFQYPIGTDHTPATTLPMEGKSLAHYKATVRDALQGAVTVDNDIEFSFYDTIELPSPPSRSRSTLVGPRKLRISVTWCIATLLSPTFENIQAAIRCTIRMQPL